MGNAFIPNVVETNENSFQVEVLDDDLPDNFGLALEQLERYRWRDVLFPSYKNTTTVSYLEVNSLVGINLFETFTVCLHIFPKKTLLKLKQAYNDEVDDAMKVFLQHTV